MKTDIHPPYYPKATITCACGAKYEAGSTSESIHVEICANCHPFYTGKQKLVDAARRVEKFQERSTKSTGLKAAASAQKVKRAERLKEKKMKEEEAVKKTKEALMAAKKMGQKKSGQ